MPVMYRVVLRRLRAEDEDELVRLSRLSADLHEGWGYMPRSPAEFADYLEGFRGLEDEALVVRLGGGEGRIVGHVTIRGIVRGPYQRGVLGYMGFTPTLGRGYLTEGVGLAVQYGFGPLGLNRLEADVRPENLPSLRLVRRLGFRREGLSPGFIRMGDRWYDYERWAITRDLAGHLAPCAEWQLPDR